MENREQKFWHWIRRNRILPNSSCCVRVENSVTSGMPDICGYIEDNLYGRDNVNYWVELKTLDKNIIKREFFYDNPPNSNSTQYRIPNIFKLLRKSQRLWILKRYPAASNSFLFVKANDCYCISAMNKGSLFNFEIILLQEYTNFVGQGLIIDTLVSSIIETNKVLVLPKTQKLNNKLIRGFICKYIGKNV